ncbi:hypothetical protein LEP1GSC170_5835 [Leptospira interrogans serovar Bataviae str. HAI135]|nr:hypothetical protein LEP1GSC170_5835 [Leptospira interrogans serovar Bataviae str. HAI135]
MELFRRGISFFISHTRSGLAGKKIVLRYKTDEESKKRIVSPLGLVAKGKFGFGGEI